MQKTKPTMMVKIVTPEKSVFEGEVFQVTLPTTVGEITILPHHIPYIAGLKSGEVLLKGERGENSIAISDGFIEFRRNQLIVLADTAERAEEIDLERAEVARKRAEDIKYERIQVDEAEFASVAVALEKEMARVGVAKKHHTRKGVHVDQNITQG